MAMKLYMDNPAIAENFAAASARLPGAGEADLDNLRTAALKRFAAIGIPGPKVEEWKYTPLGFLTHETFAVAEESAHQAEIRALYETARMADIDGPVVVFVNGYLDSELSTSLDQEGVNFAVLSQNPRLFSDSLAGDGPSSSFDDLNRAFATDGYVLDIAAGVTVEKPLQILHLATTGTDMRALRTRCRVRAGEGARAQIIETFVGAEGERYWSHTVSQVDLAPQADVRIYQLQLQGKQAIHMTELHSRVATSARFSHASLQLGAELSRSELINSFTGEFATIELCGAYLGRIRQSHDIFTRINHDQPNCQSNQLFRGVLDEGGKAAFQGKVVVARDAQKTNADQSNKNLLLSRKAEANAKPELLIYADDVKCSHGATVGELDQDQLFYLRSRGLAENAAKSLLVEAFVSEVFDSLAQEAIADRFKEKAAGWLNGEATS